MSERELRRAEGALHHAYREVTLAHLRLDDLRRGVSTASTALTEAELHARGQNPESWIEAVAPEDLSRVGRLCDSAALVGLSVAPDAHPS